MISIAQFAGCRVHMVGIGGSSMNGLAHILKQRGYVVTGSDWADSPIVEKLRQNGIPVQIGNKGENVEGAALLVFTAAAKEDNPERVYAMQHGIPQMERSELLGELLRGSKHAIGIAGTNGKTTTTAMVATIDRKSVV